MEDLIPAWPDMSDEDEFGVFFSAHDISFDLPDAAKVQLWIQDTISAEGFELSRLDFVFCTDEFLLQINRDHLGHDYYTDIITFPLNAQPILAEIYISIDRVKENASTLNIPFEQELHRVIIHGVLHLCGYDDHEEDDIKVIRQKEEACLGNFPKK